MAVFGNVYTIKDPLHRDISIKGTRGLIVVTREQDPDDHILAEGESLTIKAQGLLAIRGLTGDAQATVFSRKWGREGRAVDLPA